MRKTLIIKPEHHTTILRTKGLSIKAAGSAGHDICKDESGYYISNRFHINPRTAKIELNYLVKFLSELIEEIPFTDIKIIGAYEASGAQIIHMIEALLSK